VTTLTTSLTPTVSSTTSVGPATITSVIIESQDSLDSLEPSVVEPASQPPTANSSSDEVSQEKGHRQLESEEGIALLTQALNENDKSLAAEVCLMSGGIPSAATWEKAVNLRISELKSQTTAVNGGLDQDLTRNERVEPSQE
jgi:hypothetical protein